MTDVYHGEDIAFDLYPKTDPKNGPRIRRLTSLQTGSFIRREQKGTGVVTIVIPGDSDDAEAIDPALGHYIKAERKGAPITLALSSAADDIVDTGAAHGLSVGHKLEFVTLTGGAGLSLTPVYYVQAVPTSTSLRLAATKGGAAIGFTTDITAGSIRRLTTVAGGFLLGGNYNALSADGTKPLVLTGPGPLHYLARARMAPHSYLGDDPQPEGIFPLHMQGAWFGDDHYGSEFARALTEMKATQADDPGDDPDSPHPNDNDRLLDPLPAITFDFDGFTDSNGIAWTGARGEFDVQVALEDGLRIAFRFMQAGLEIDIDPDTFELRAYNTGTLGTDRSGPAWGAGIVRFQVPTDNKVGTSNVFTTAKRALAAFIQRSLEWAGRENVWGVARNASAPVLWEGGYSSQASSEAANNTVAQQQIVERTDAGDVPRLRVWAGNNQAAGQYTYGPDGHADIWDRGTVHSGTGTWDWNQWEGPLSALEWRIENPNGEFDTFVEFGSTFRALDEVMRFAGGAIGVHGPHIRFCPPARACHKLTIGEMEPATATNGDVEAGAANWSLGGVTAVHRHGGTQGYEATGASIAIEFDFGAQVFLAGVRYVLDIWSRIENDHDVSTIYFGDAGGDEESTVYQGVPGNDPADLWDELATGADGGTWARGRVCWTPSAERTNVRVRFESTSFTSGWHAVDDLALYIAPSDLGGNSPFASRCGHGHYAREIRFLNGGTDLESDNVQDLGVELAERIAAVAAEPSVTSHDDLTERDVDGAHNQYAERGAGLGLSVDIVAAAGAALTLDLAYTHHKITLTTACVITLPTIATGGLQRVFSLELVGDFDVTLASEDGTVTFVGVDDLAADGNELRRIVLDTTDGTHWTAKHRDAALSTSSSGHILITSEPAGSPLVFTDLMQNSEGTDLLYASEA